MRIIAKLSQGDSRRADFSNAELGADMGNQSMGLMRFEAAGADLSGAVFTGAKLNHALFQFADLSGADFSDADLRSAEFDGADLTAADFTGADVTGASFDRATLKNVRGMHTANEQAAEN